jgi:hypothetical protein
MRTRTTSLWTRVIVAALVCAAPCLVLALANDPADTRLEALAHELETSGILQNPEAGPFTQQAAGLIRHGNLQTFIDMLDNLQTPMVSMTLMTPDMIKHFRDEAETLRDKLVVENHAQARNLGMEARRTFNQAQKPEDLDAFIAKLPLSTDTYDGRLQRGDELNERDRQDLSALRAFAEHYRFFLSLIQADDQSRLTGSYRELVQENTAFFYVDPAHLDKLFSGATPNKLKPVGPQVDAIVDQLVADGDYNKALDALRALPPNNSASAIDALSGEINTYSIFLISSIPHAEFLENLTHFMDACHCESVSSAWTPKLQPLYRELVTRFLMAYSNLGNYPPIDAAHETVVAYLHRLLAQAQAAQNWDDVNKFIICLFIYGDNYHTRMSFFQQQDAQSCEYYTEAVGQLDQKRYAEAMENAYLAVLNARSYGPRREATALLHQLQADHPDDYALVVQVLRYSRMSALKTQATDMREQSAYLVPTDL